MNRKQILQAADLMVNGNREQDYGSPENNFNTIAQLWTVYLKQACVSSGADVCINPKDVAALLALLKIARIASGHAKDDNWIDLAGYAACGGELESGDDSKTPSSVYFTKLLREEYFEATEKTEAET